MTYNGELRSLSALAQAFFGWKRLPAGPRFFKYKGEWLNVIRACTER